MPRQLIIALGREFGSGGHEIARTLAERFGIPLYDKNMLELIAEMQGLDPDRLDRYDEMPKRHLVTRTVSGYSNAPQEVIAEMQFQFLRERAAACESFVVLGRCAEEVLKDYPGLISIFVLADQEFKKQRTMERAPISEWEALALMAQQDRQRQTYHNQFCSGKWGDARNWDLTINSARLGIPATVDLLEQYIRFRMETLNIPLRSESV